MSQMYKVVIVEDEEIIRKGLMFTIHWTDLECTVVADCGNGEEGVKAIQEFRPDIVITDINMPVVDGLEMIRRTFEEYEYAAVILSVCKLVGFLRCGCAAGRVDICIVYDTPEISGGAVVVKIVNTGGL